MDAHPHPHPLSVSGQTAARFSAFSDWLKNRGVSIHPSVLPHDFSCTHQGWGLVAGADIPKHTLLFSIPRPPNRSPLLTIQTSELFRLLEPEHANRCAKNWVKLLVVMIWERVRGLCAGNGEVEHWGPYFDMMPEEFDTLMFWSEDELKELQGSTILDKIGKEEAEADYNQIVRPLIQARPDLFPVPPNLSWAECYGLDVYHRMGSLVLSRSFHVDATPDRSTGDVSMETASSVDVDDRPQESLEDETELDNNVEEVEEVEEDELDSERLEDIAMVPLADLLNAKSGCENAKLFYEPESLNMMSTKLIKKGDQIYNTYADPPNADLLRRYGHVDDPNEFDVAEVGLATCLEACAQAGSWVGQLEVRAEWALGMGLDDSFDLPTAPARRRAGLGLLPDDMVSMLRILLASDADFEAARAKEKLPKPKISPELARVAVLSLERRLSQYPTSIETDSDLLKTSNLPPRKLKALIVRMSEKKILQETRQSLIDKFKLGLSEENEMREVAVGQGEKDNHGKVKRKNDEGGDQEKNSWKQKRKTKHG